MMGLMHLYGSKFCSIFFLEIEKQCEVRRWGPTLCAYILSFSLNSIFNVWIGRNIK